MTAAAAQLPLIEPVADAPAATAWPEVPYRGLNYYGPEHLPLFAGREHDVQRAAELLASPGVRLFALHGASGCGKSSLLRAALVPMLEGDIGGFRFLRQGSSSSVVFIRCTARPLLKLAEELFRFIERGVELESPRGRQHVPLKEVCAKGENLDDFLKRVGASPEQLLATIKQVVQRVPRTLVLIVDQAEEVLTLLPGPLGEAWRQQLWEFLALLTTESIDLKVVVCLRTEYYGRFRHELSAMDADLANVAEYYLGPLRERDLAAAIERPTLTRPIGAFGAPHEVYGFAFAPGVALRIAQEIIEAAPPGGVLPTLQMVCTRLYNETRKLGNGAEITLDQFRKLGSIDEQLYDHLDAELEAVLTSELGSRDKSFDLRERWKTLLSELVHLQVDGTVTTEVRPLEDLSAKAKKLRLPRFEETMDVLCSDERRICRKVRVPRLTRSTDNASPRTEILNCYALGHDALGLALQRWGTVTRDRADAARRLGLVGLVLLALAPVVFAFGAVYDNALLFAIAAYLALAGCAYVVAWRLPSTRYGVVGRLLDNTLREKRAKKRSVSGAWLSPTLNRLTDIDSDPQKGQWGGLAERDGLRLSASVTPISGDSEYISVTLSVTPVDSTRSLEGSVRFHLHPTFAIPDPGVEVRDGKAVLQVTTWGAFTVGAEADEGTQLELNLVDHLPEPFRSR